MYPLDVAVGAEETRYVADRKLPGLWTLKDGKTDVLFQASRRFRTPLNAVRCVCTGPDGQLFAGDSATREVYAVSENGELTPLTGGRIGIPISMAVAGDHLYVGDLELQRVWKVPVAGGDPEEFLVTAGPRGVAVDSDQNVWVLTPHAPQLRKFSPGGESEVIVGDAPFQFPHQVVVAEDGTAYVSDGYAKAIWKIAPGESPAKLVEGKPLDNPVGITLAGDVLLVIDSRANALFRVAADGTISRAFPSEDR
ncbi:MAG: hypothetical protein ACF8TS_20620 [Maioricimonas sp. JB049]